MSASDIFFFSFLLLWAQGLRRKMGAQQEKKNVEMLIFLHVFGNAIIAYVIDDVAVRS